MTQLGPLIITSKWLKISATFNESEGLPDANSHSDLIGGILIVIYIILNGLMYNCIYYALFNC